LERQVEGSLSNRLADGCSTGATSRSMSLFTFTPGRLLTAASLGSFHPEST